MRHPTPTTLREHVARKIASTLTCTALVAGSFAVSYPLAQALIPSRATFVEHGQPAPTPRPMSPKASEAAMWADLLGCWEKEAPADMRGKYPTRVVTVRGGVSDDPAVVAKALQQTIDGTDHGMAVVAFCR